MWDIYTWGLSICPHSKFRASYRAESWSTPHFWANLELLGQIFESQLSKLEELQVKGILPNGWKRASKRHFGPNRALVAPFWPNLVVDRPEHFPYVTYRNKARNLWCQYLHWKSGQMRSPRGATSPPKTLLALSKANCFGCELHQRLPILPLSSRCLKRLSLTGRFLCLASPFICYLNLHWGDQRSDPASTRHSRGPHLPLG